MKRKLSVLFVLIAMILIIVTFVVSMKYPNNFIYGYEGEYKKNCVITLYNYDNTVFAIVRNNEKTFDAFDDDDCFDDMITIAVIDHEDNIVDTIPIIETYTPENDGNGIRSSEVGISSYQANNLIYLSLNVHDKNYMVEFNMKTLTYEINEMEVFFKEFIVDDAIKGVSLAKSNEFMVDVMYHEFSLEQEKISSKKLSEFDRYKSDYPFSAFRVEMDNEWIIYYGDSDNNYYTYKYITKYNVTENYFEQVFVPETYIEFHKNNDEINYAVVYLYSVELYNMDDELIDSHEISEDNEGRIHEAISCVSNISSDEDFRKSQIKLYSSVTNFEYIIPFENRVICHKIYVFGEDIYLIVTIKGGILNQIINRSNDNIVIHYTYNTLEDYKTK